MNHFPRLPNDLTPELLTQAMAPIHPGTSVTNITILDHKIFGDGEVSTAGRATVALEYAGDVANLPKQVIVKMARHDTDFLRPLYMNEVTVYAKLRPEIEIETPQVYGAVCDNKTASFLLMLEDLSLRGATFPNVKTHVTIEHIQDLIRSLAKLHSKYWESPRFATDLSWLETHLKGGTHDFFEDPEASRGVIQREVEQEQFKREIVQRLRTTVDEMHADYHRLQEHQSRLPQTLLHGDSHIGNTYLLPGLHGGFVDWQLTVRGYFMHDLSYLLTTSLDIAQRRQHERELIGYYLEHLRAGGVADAPSFETAWLEYRRAALWNFYIGWITTPTTFYGFEIVLLNLLRGSTAFEDHETAKLLKAMR